MFKLELASFVKYILLKQGNVEVGWTSKTLVVGSLLSHGGLDQPR